MFCHTCDLEIKHSLYECPFCAGPLSEDPPPQNEHGPQKTEQLSEPSSPAAESEDPPPVPDTEKPFVIAPVETNPSGAEHPVNTAEMQNPENEIITFISHNKTGETDSVASGAQQDDQAAGSDTTAFVSFGQPEPADGKSVEAPKKRSFPTKRVLISSGVAAALILAVVLFVNFIKPSLSQAAAALYGDIATRIDASVFVVAKPLSTCLENGEVYADVSYTDEHGDTISGIVSYASSNADAMHSLSLNAEIYHNEFDAVLFISEDHVSLGSTLLDGSFYGLRFDSFPEDFAKFADTIDLGGVSSDDFIEFVNMIDYAFNGDNMFTLPENTLHAVNEMFIEFFLGLQSSSARETVTLSGNTVNASVLTYNCTVGDIIELGYKLTDFARTDENMRLYLTAYLKAVGSYTYYEYYSGSYVREPAPFTFSILSEPVDYFLNDVCLLLDTLAEYCSGDFLIRLITAKGRLCALQLDATFDVEQGNTFLFRLDLDFGQTVYDDWSLDFSVRTGEAHYEFGAVWTFSDSDGASVNEITLTSRDGTYTDQLIFNSQWVKNTGLFSVSLRDVAGDVNINLRGTLDYRDDGFALTLNTTPELYLSINGSASCTLSQPVFINLDMWDENTLLLFDSAVSTLYNNIYSYPTGPELYGRDTVIVTR